MSDAYRPPSAPLEPEGPAAIGAFEAVAGAFTSPGETFSRLMVRPTWWLPFVLVVLLCIPFGILSAKKTDWDTAAQEAMQKQAAKSGQTMPPDAAERMVPFMRAGAMIGTPVIVALFWFGAVLVFWGASRAFGAETRFAQAAALWAHASLPNTVGLVLALPVMAFVGDGSVRADRMEHLLKCNVGAFLPDGTSPVLLSLATSLDLFSFATLTLLVIGLRRLKGLSEGTATGLGIGLWVIWVLIRAGLASFR